MKRISIVGALGLLILAVAGCGGPAKSSLTDQPGGSQAACAHPFPGDNKVTRCAYPGGLFSISYPGVTQYYWNPAPGYFAVAETYYQAAAPGRTDGAWTGRTISVGDGCVIDDNWTPSTTTPPSNCMDSRTGNYRGATATEQHSVLKFWQLMTSYVTGADRLPDRRHRLVTDT